MSQGATKANLVMEAPRNWLKMVENIRIVRKKYPAPVDSMGCDQVGRNGEDIGRRFQVLVSLMLSSQTKDPITWAATQKLRERGICNVEGLLATPEKDIEDLIHPVGFYRRKAVYLKKMAAILSEHFNGDIPNSIEGLCALPGVGPKMAHLCMQEAWNVNSGIGVDTHVHRISARLGWVPTKHVKTPEDTRVALESWMPSEYWREINHLLVGFGQTICTPLRPKCDECVNSEICPSSSAARSAARSTKEKKTTVTTRPSTTANTATAATRKRKATGDAGHQTEANEGDARALKRSPHERAQKPATAAKLVEEEEEEVGEKKLAATAGPVAPATAVGAATVYPNRTQTGTRRAVTRSALRQIGKGDAELTQDTTGSVTGGQPGRSKGTRTGAAGARVRAKQSG